MNSYEILRGQLASAIEPISGSDTERIVDTVLRTLEQQKVVSYAKVGDIKLLSPAGRVFVAVLENPSMTQRALSIYLGMHEQQVQKAIKSLENAGLLVTTKLGTKKNASLKSVEALRHPDITRFFDVISKVVKEKIVNQKR